MRRIHGVEDILLGFEPKDAGSIPAGSVFIKMVDLQNKFSENLIMVLINDFDCWEGSALRKLRTSGYTIASLLLNAGLIRYRSLSLLIAKFLSKNY